MKGFFTQTSSSPPEERGIADFMENDDDFTGPTEEEFK